MKIAPARKITGTISVPGDKSISHRAALVAALATGTSSIKNFSTSDDCNSTLGCLSQLGVPLERNGNDVVLQGSGIAGFRPPAAPLDCGNSGSTMRMLAGVLAGQQFPSVLTGDGSLKRRPMQRIIEPLQLMGARVTSDDGRPPLRIEGGQELTAHSYEMPVASAQLKTCLLLAGLIAQGRTEVVESKGDTRDHTERLLQLFGLPVSVRREPSGVGAVTIVGPAHFKSQDVNIPGDFSSAAYLIVAAALLKESDLTIRDLGLNPTRTRLLTTLEMLGVKFSITNEREDSNEKVGTVNVAGGFDHPNEAIVIRGEDVAAMIDELPLLAVIGTQLNEGLIIEDADELRVKESDRLAVTVRNLRAMGAQIEETGSGLVVRKSQLKGAVIETHKDHRIAMAFAIAALLADGESKILGSDRVRVSFPEFFSVLDSIVVR